MRPAAPFARAGGRARGWVHLTDPFYDIDVAADLSQLADELQRLPGKAPRTAKWLSEWASAGANKGFP